MIQVNSRRHPSAALLLRRLSTGIDQARSRTTHDNQFKPRSALRDAGHAVRNRPNSFVTPSTASQTSFNAPWQQTARAEIPIASDA